MNNETILIRSRAIILYKLHVFINWIDISNRIRKFDRNEVIFIHKTSKALLKARNILVVSNFRDYYSSCVLFPDHLRSSYATRRRKFMFYIFFVCIVATFFIVIKWIVGFQTKLVSLNNKTLFQNCWISQRLKCKK